LALFASHPNPRPDWLIEEPKEEHVKLCDSMRRLLGTGVMDLKVLAHPEPRPPVQIFVFDPKNPVIVPPTREECLRTILEENFKLVEESIRSSPDAVLLDNCDVEALEKEED
jgi:hypothetical protein